MKSALFAFILIWSNCFILITGEDLESRNGSCIGGFNKLGFIINNNCSNNGMCVPFQDGWFCVQIDESYFVHKQWKSHVADRQPSDRFCDKMLCQYSKLCTNGTCECIKHFTGKYCGKPIDYCVNHECKNNATCLPRLGGYNCKCTINRIGRYCEYVDVQDLNAFEIMKHPDFLLDIFQFSGFESTYVFFSHDLGRFPNVTVDFGDGTLVKETAFMVLKNATQVLSLLFRLPLGFKHDELQVYTFKHTYQKGRLYDVEVNGWNGHFHIFNTTYQIKVADDTPSLEIIFHSKRDLEEVWKFYRKSAIFFPVAVKSNYNKIYFKSLWNLYQLNGSVDSMSSRTLFANSKVNSSALNLYIPPFTMDYGEYSACLTVTLIQPMNKSKVTCTRFIVLRGAFVAHIQGGTSLSRSIDKAFRLDASLSFDPNFHRDGQPSLVYSWTCSPKNGFCRGMSPLDETSAILTVPSDALKKDSYNFQVMVDYVSVSEENAYTGIAKQEIQITEAVECFYFINCTNNCVGGVANPHEAMVIVGFVECEKKVDRQFAFFLQNDSSPLKENQAISLKDTDFYQELIMYEFELKPDAQYNFLFNAVGRSDSELPRDAQNSCIMMIKTLKSVSKEVCTVNPSSGIAVITDFTINCTRLLSEDPLAVMHEITQIVHLNRPKIQGILHGYSLSDCITQVSLGTGIQKYNFVTYLAVRVTYSNGISFISLCNVTVYPLYLYATDLETTWSYIAPIIIGKTSHLNVYLQNGNEYEVVQQMISIATSIKYMYKYTNFNDSQFPFSEIRDILMHYLMEVPTSNIYTTKFVISARNSIINMLPWKNLYWSTTIYSEIKFEKTIIKELKDYFKNKEQILTQLQIDMIFIDFLSIACKIFKVPSPDFTIFRDDLPELESVIDRYIEMDNLNPYNINPDTLLYFNNQLMTQFLFYIMDTYINAYQGTRTRPFVITSKGLYVVMQKNFPQSVSSESLSISNRANINLNFNSSLFQNNIFAFKILMMDNNPYWYFDQNNSTYAFPHITVEVRDPSQAVKKIPLDIDLFPIRNKDTTFPYGGALPISLLWEYDDENFQVYKIYLNKGGKLVVKFKPLQKGLKLLVVIKQFSEPTASDFREMGILIPQFIGGGWSIFVDDPAQDEKVLYYMGVSVALDTIRQFTEDSEKPILEENFHYDDLTDKKVKRDAQTGKEIQNIDYNFTAFCAYCFSYQKREKYWTWKNCKVKFVSSSAAVSCSCVVNDVVTAHMKIAEVDSVVHLNIETELSFEDNPIIVFVITFMCLLFLGLFKWALEQDREDMLRRTVCFLVDNYPEFEYTYLVIVYSGRNVKGGTTSNITIQLEGTLDFSLAHVLRDWSRPVLIRGSQDWFVIKTAKSLGDICRLHIWADFSGEKPNWLCDKVIVHDIQCQKIWFFLIKKWFDPLMDDGSMSNTNYQTTDEIIFSASHYFVEILQRELDAGIHGWLSIFYKYPYNNYTRTQRVAVAFTHMVMIMLILMNMYGFPQADVPEDQIYRTADYALEWNDLYCGFVATMIAFPMHLLLVCFFRSIKPNSRWIESRLDHSLSRFNMESADSYDIMWISSEMKSLSSKIIMTSHKNREWGRVNVSLMQTSSEPKNQMLEGEAPRERRKNDRVTRRNRMTPTIASSSDTDSSSYFNKSFKSVDFGSPKYSTVGENTVTQSYFFQPYYNYIAWILLLTIAIPCTYALVLNGMSYGWVVSLHYLTGLFLATVISTCFLETLKWFLWSTYLFFLGRQVYAIEDRTDLVLALNMEFKIPELLKNRIVKKINKLRENSIYQPLSEDVLYKIKKNRIYSFMIRLMISKVMLLVLFGLLQAVIAATIFLPNGYLHITNLKNLVRQSATTHTNLVGQIQCKEHLVEYLRETLIPNLQSNNQSQNSSKLFPTVDRVNYLIGVIRLRQIRKDFLACKIRETPKWEAHCPPIYDEKDFAVRWKPLNNTSKKFFNSTWFDAVRCPWSHDNEKILFRNTVTYHNRSRYPNKGYIVKLDRTTNKSQAIIQFLEKTNWFDDLTAVVYIDFVLYNPRIYTLTDVSVMAERTDQGLYYVHQNYIYNVMHPSQTSGQMYLLVYLLITFIWLMTFIHTQSQKYTLIKAKKLVSSKFGWKRRLFLLLAFTSVVLHINKTIYLDYYNNIIRNGNSNEYMSIGWLVFMTTCISLTISLMFVLIIFEFICILNTVLTIKFVITNYLQALKAMLSFFVSYVLFLSAFNWIYYMQFGSQCYHYHDFLTGIYSKFTMLSRNDNCVSHGNQHTNIVLSALLFFTYAISMVCIWQSFGKAMIISIYCTVKRNRRKNLRARHASVLNHYTQKYFATVDGKSNRKEERYQKFFRRLEPRLNIMRYLVGDWYCTKPNQPESSKNYRHEAMKVVILEELLKIGYFSEETSLESTNEENWRIENMVQVMRVVVLRNLMILHLRTLDKRIDVLSYAYK